MNTFLFIVKQILAICLAFSTGFIVRRFRQNRIDLNTLSELIIYIGSPCLVFTKIATTTYETNELFVLAGAMIFFIFGIGAINLILSRILGFKQDRVFYLATMFMNTANVGFPVTLFVLGAVAFQKAIILDLTMILILFSFGVGLVSRQYGEVLKMPVLYAAILGFVFSFGGLQLPQEIFKSLSMLGDITVPLMILSLGAKMADLKKIDNIGRSIIATIVRSGCGLLLGLSYVLVFKVTGLTRSVIILYSALPAPIMAYILAQKYHKNDHEAAAMVLISNLSAIVVLPIILYFLIR
jgi:predicted permease